MSGYEIETTRRHDAIAQLGFEKVGMILADSGYFQDARQIPQAIAKVMAGHEMGLSPFESMTGIHVIKGKPVVGGHLVASAIKRHPRYDYRIRERSAEVCEIEFYEAGESVGKERWDLARAKRAGLSGGNWNSYPEAMLFNRCISSGYKVYCPDVFSAAVYVEGELDDAPDARIVDVEVVDPGCNGRTDLKPMARPTEIRSFEDARHHFPDLGPETMITKSMPLVDDDDVGLALADAEAWQGRLVGMIKGDKAAWKRLNPYQRAVVLWAKHLRDGRHAADLDRIRDACETTDDLEHLCHDAGVKLKPEEIAQGLAVLDGLSRARVKKLLAQLDADAAGGDSDGE